MKKQYVTDIIGDDYLNWKLRDKIVISTPTGSGKTTFILKKLLRNAAAQNKHLVYFCNRRILNFEFQEIAKNQLLSSLEKGEQYLAAFLHVRTYQHAEICSEFPDIREIDENDKVLRTLEVASKDILYYVFDEAHYFVSDASFNNKTNYWVRKKYEIVNCPAISVFLTATPEPLYLFFMSLYGANVPHRFFSSEHAYLEDMLLDLKVRQFFKAGYKVKQCLYFLSDAYKRVVAEKGLWELYESYDEHQAKLESIYSDVEQGCAEPFNRILTAIRNLYHGKVRGVTKEYKFPKTSEERYAYINEYYFHLFDELYDLINRKVDIGEKWLIFVKSKAEGINLKAVLDTMGITSDFITANETKKYNPKNDKNDCEGEKSVFEILVKEERLTVPVLIATSALDCGINLFLSDVQNLVICQPNKNSFLQMLGRIRINTDKSLNVYIHFFSAKQIKGYYDSARRTFDQLITLYFNNLQVSHSTVSDSNSLEGLIVLSQEDSIMNELISKPKYFSYISYDPEGNGPMSGKVKAPSSVLHVNELGLLNLLSTIYLHKVELYGGAYAKENQNEDSCEFLKLQLSWIGKKYDSNRWVGSNKRRKDVMSYLSEASDCGWLDKNAQENFRANCLEYLIRINDESVEINNLRTRYGGRTSNLLPGISKLNALFEKLNLPYKIIAKQRRHKKYGSMTGDESTVEQPTYWKVVHCDESVE